MSPADASSVSFMDRFLLGGSHASAEVSVVDVGRTGGGPTRKRGSSSMHFPMLTCRSVRLMASTKCSPTRKDKVSRYETSFQTGMALECRGICMLNPTA